MDDIWQLSDLALWPIVALLGAFLIGAWQELAHIHARLDRISPRKSRYEVGERVAPFTLPDATGGRVSLGRLRGRNVMLLFVTADCPACDEALSVLSKYAARLEEKNWITMAVLEGEAANGVDLAGQLAAPGLVLKDTQRRLWQRYQVRQVPLAMALDENLVLISQTVGLSDAWLEAVLAEPPLPARTMIGPVSAM